MPFKPSESPEATVSEPHHYRMLICGILLSSMVAVTGCDYSAEEPVHTPVPEEPRSDDVRIVPDETERVPKVQPEERPEEYKPDKEKTNRPDDGDEEKPEILSCNNDCKFV